MPDVDVIDSSWIGVPAGAVGAALAEPTRWRRGWPDLELALAEHRGPKGVRWTVRSADSGRLRGSMEIWLEPAAEGVLAHYFLRLDARAGTVAERDAERLVHQYRTRTKRVMWALADELDPGRLGRITAPRR